MQPWLTNWKIERALGNGGQGTTSIVSSLDGHTSAVLKLLRKDGDEQARRRMAQEVINLRVLFDAGCRVPRVLDGNTHEFENREVPLFFVMEYFPGETLAQVVEKNKGLPLEESIEIARCLANTVKGATEVNVIHRDLKPDNIIQASTDSVDFVIVDYGLFFNSLEPVELTRVSETLDNSFLSLPERRVPGGNRRDPRSDLTGLCGLLFYCLTAKRPVDLRDANNLPPHRRKDSSIKEKLGTSPNIQRLESFLDRGFAVHIEDRFQSADELLRRLDDIERPSPNVATEDPFEVAERVSNRLLTEDRSTQLANYRGQANKLIHDLQQYSGKFTKRKLGIFEIRLITMNLVNKIKSVEFSKNESLGESFVFHLGSRHHEYRRGAAYSVVAQGRQIGIYRSDIALKNRNAETIALTTDPEPLFWIEGDAPIDETSMAILYSDIDASVARSIHSLGAQILGS